LKTDLGRIPGTFTENESELSIGESTATLASRGMWYHALTRVGADGTEEDGLYHMMDTPSGIATIFSEVVEVKTRRTTIAWSPDAPRIYHTAGGVVMPLSMSNNGLGWLGIRAITDMNRIRTLLSQAGVNIIAPIYPQPNIDTWSVVETQPPITNYTIAHVGDEGNIADSPTRPNIAESPLSSQRAQYLDGVFRTARESAIYVRSPSGFPPLPERAALEMAQPVVLLTDELARSTRNYAETALVQARSTPKGTMPPSVGMGRMVKLTGLEILRRMHVVLGHPSLPVLLATLEASKDVNAHLITKSDVEQYVREACGICESAKMRRRAFRGITDPTPVPVGKKWVFDTVHLRVPSCQWKFIYITRFVNKMTDFPGYKRSYGHVTFTSEELIKLCQRHAPCMGSTNPWGDHYLQARFSSGSEVEGDGRLHGGIGSS
jgi:hypothetical protein